MSEDLEGLKRRTEEKFQELAQAQKHTDERMDALITIVDEIVRAASGNRTVLASQAHASN